MQKEIIMSNKKLMLIDGHSLIFRAFYAMYGALDSMKNSQGLHTNALYAFHNMITNILEKEEPTHVLVAFDAGKTTIRHDVYQDYKGGRDKMPSELSEQMPYFKEMLTALGLHYYELPLYEADDIIGTLSARGEELGYDVVVLSGDKDLIQLATEQIRVDITRKGVSQLESFTPEKIQEELGLKPLQVIDLIALAGDPSDNIPGVTGVGEKTALKYLHEYGSVENLYAHIDELNKSKRKENLIAEKDIAEMGRKIAEIIQDAPINVEIEDLKYQKADTEKLVDLYRELNFESHLKKLDSDDYLDDLEDEQIDLSYEWLDEIKEEHLENGSVIYFEIDQSNYHRAEIIGIGIGTRDQIYLTDAETIKNSSAFVSFIRDENISKILYDSKSAGYLLHRLDMELSGVEFDIALASYILTGEDSSGSVESLGSKHDYTKVLPDEALYGKGKVKKLPEDTDKVHQHIASKVKASKDLTEILKAELEKNQQMQLLEDMELPLARILMQMEIEGVRLDIDQLKALGSEYAEKLDQIKQEIFEIAGEEFNINSPKQLSTILFEKMDYEPVRKTKTGYSTAQDVLEKIQAREDAPIVNLILSYRKFKKIESTYVKGLLSEVNPNTQIVHTIFQQYVTRTGRLSSTDPNLQNIPVRRDEGREIRKAFVPKHPNYKMYGADYSQIELRLLAHMSGDQHLIEAFQNGEDIHSTTAMRVFNIDDADDVTTNIRRDAKAVNFGIVYGISDYGLSENLGIPRREAKEIIDTYFDRFPDVKKYIDETIREAKNNGFVETLYGRRRYLPDINSSNFNRRSFAKRTAMNTPIQGSAADILKMAMIAIDEKLQQNNLASKMLLQVHDELIFEGPEEEMKQVEELVTQTMEHIVDLDVPLKVDGGSGNNWYEIT